MSCKPIYAYKHANYPNLDTEGLFSKIFSLRRETAKIGNYGDEAKRQYWEKQDELLAETVWLSNSIDGVGLSLTATKAILKGIGLKNGVIVNGTPDALREICCTCATLSRDIIIKGSINVISYKRAFRNLAQNTTPALRMITPETLRKAHSDIVQYQPWKPLASAHEIGAADYAGKYLINQSWVPHNYQRSPDILRRIDQWFQDLETDLKNANKNSTIDPFYVAAKFSLRLVLLAPFATDNGRIARLVAVAIIWRFTSTTVSLGVLPTTVVDCSAMMNPKLLEPGIETFAKFLFQRTVKSVIRSYGVYVELTNQGVGQMAE